MSNCCMRRPVKFHVDSSARFWAIANIREGGASNAPPLVKRGLIDIEAWDTSHCAPTGGRGTRPPFEPENTIFSGFLPLNYVICIFKVWFFSALCGRTEEACSMVNSLRKVDFSHPTGHYIWKKVAPPPWENPGCAPGYYDLLRSIYDLDLRSNFEPDFSVSSSMYMTRLVLTRQA